MTVPIILDCDPGHDDAIAILLAATSPAIDLRAVTTVAGNTVLDKTTANAIRVLDLLGLDIPVAAGADRPLVRPLVVAEHIHGVSGMDGPALAPPSRNPDSRHAVELMASVVEKSERPVTLVPVGPLTNVALFLAVYPHLAARLERVVLMGGSMGMGNVTPSAEFNIYVDPEAAQRVFSSGLDVTMVGLDVTHRALLRPSDAARLGAGGTVARFVADLYRFFSRHEPASGSGGVPVHDALAVGHLIWDDLVVTERLAVEVDRGELGRGRTVVDRRRRGAGPGSIHVATEVDGARFADLLVEHIEALDGDVRGAAGRPPP